MAEQQPWLTGISKEKKKKDILSQLIINKHFHHPLCFNISTTKSFQGAWTWDKRVCSKLKLKSLLSSIDEPFFFPREKKNTEASMLLTLDSIEKYFYGYLNKSGSFWHSAAYSVKDTITKTCLTAPFCQFGQTTGQYLTGQFLTLQEQLCGIEK